MIYKIVGDFTWADNTSSPLGRPGEVSSFGVIGGGQGNTIAAGTNHSSIFSGNGNTVAGSCSSILGGSGNSDGGFNYVGIFGQGITGVCDNMFHVNCLWAGNLPLASGGAPGPLVAGTVWVDDVTVPGSCFLMIK